MQLSLRSWIDRLAAPGFGRRKKRNASHRPKFRRLGVELLEDRRLLSDFYLSFPLPHKTADTVAINAVFDHSMPDGEYTADNVVVAYTGERGERQNGQRLVTTYGGTALHGFKMDVAGTPFNVNGHYYEGSPDDAKFLYYNGHPGYDFRTRDQSPFDGRIDVLAAASGTAHRLIAPNGVPWGVRIDHGNGYKTNYYHLSEINVPDGATVTRRQVIGVSGGVDYNGANTLAPHLHFSVMLNDVPVDPYGWQGVGEDPYLGARNEDLWIASPPEIPSNPSPVNGAILSVQPGKLDWDNAARATSYDVYLDGSFIDNVAASEWPLNRTLAARQHTWQVNAKNSVGATSSPLWSFTINPLVNQPEIMVLGNGQNIQDDDTTPSASDGTDFGRVEQGHAGPTRTFTVRNDGTATLTLGSVNRPLGVTVTEGLNGTLAPGAFDTFTIRLDTSTAGTKTGDISFSTNDSDENPFNFRITGTVAVPTAPEITVLGNEQNITDGDTTPRLSDGTDFGSVEQGHAGPTRTFTVRNDGAATLTLTSLAVPEGFVVEEALDTSLVLGDSDTFTVRLLSTTTGPKSGDITVDTNDTDENPFNFAIAGTVTAHATPEITVSGKGQNIADGDTTPSTSDGTDFGSVEQGQAGPIRTFTVRNDGTATLTLTSLAVPGGFVVEEGLDTNLVLGDSDTFTVRLLSTTTGPKSGDITVDTNDTDENPFNFRISGTVSQTSDTMRPNVSIVAPDVASSGGSSYTFYGRYTDNVAVDASDIGDDDMLVTGPRGYSQRVSLASKTSTSDKSPIVATYTITPPGGFWDLSDNGDYTVSMQPSQVSDTSGNFVPAGDLRTFTVRIGDTVKPTAPTITGFRENTGKSDTDRLTNDATPTFTWTASTDVGTGVKGYWWSVDDTPPQTVGTFTTALSAPTSVGEGPHTFYLRAEDMAGNLSNPSVYGFEVDTTAPTVLATSPADETTVSPAPTEIRVYFSEAMDQISQNGLLPSHLSLSGPGLGSAFVSGASWVKAEVARFSIGGTWGTGQVNLALAGPWPQDEAGNPPTSYSGWFSIRPGTENDAPTIGSLTDSPDPVWRDFTLTLEAHDVIDTDGQVVRVEFYRDSNKDGKLDVGVDQLLGQDVSGADGWTWSGPVSGFPLGENRYFARAQDNLKAWSEQPATTTGIVGAPEIIVDSGLYDIVDGDSTPRSLDGTKFGTVAVGDPAVEHTFWVTNRGDQPLILGTVSLPEGFTLVEPLVSSLDPGHRDTFTVRLDTTTAGTKTGDITFSTNDSDENPFNFRITGTVMGPEITVLGHGREISDDDTTPSILDATDFRSVNQGQSGPAWTFKVRNDGTATLTLGPVNVPSGFTLTEPLTTSLAPRKSDTFTVRLDTDTPGTKTGDITFSTNDSDENPFNFRITGTVTPRSTDTGSISGYVFVDRDLNGQYDDGEGLSGWTVVLEEAGGVPHLLQTFENPSPATNDLFGSSVAAVGDNVLVGAYHDDTGAEDTGAAYLFDGQTGALLARFPDPENPTHPTVVADEAFGYSVAAVGNNILVGAHGRPGARGEPRVGEAYLFDGDTKDLLHIFSNPFPGDRDWFGWSVAAVGNDVLIGARFDDTGADNNTGAAYLFDGNTGNLKLAFPDPANPTHPILDPSDQFGFSLAVVGNNIVIGTPMDDGGAQNAGCVYLFDGSTGDLLRRIPNPSPAIDDKFGWSVSATDSRVFVGAPYDDTGAPGAGTTYVFDASTGVLLQELQSLSAAAADWSGYAVTAVGDNVLVGAPEVDVGGESAAGAAYLFDSSTGKLVQTFQDPTPRWAEEFGFSVTAAGNNILVGAPREGPGISDFGAAYLFQGPAVTDQNGFYSFTGLQPGAYQLRQSVATGYTQTLPLNGAIHELLVRVDQELSDVNFGNRVVGDAMPPVVTGVTVDSYSIPVGDGGQLTTLPWAEMNQIKLAFSEDVNVKQDDLTLEGVNVPEYAFKADLPDGWPNDGFVYDPGSFTATWTLNSPIGADKLRVHLDSGPGGVTDKAGNALDGEWTDAVSVFPSGDGTAGGDFRFRLNVLPGDTNGDRTTNLDDGNGIRDRMFAYAADPNYSAVYDVNGSGRIDFLDWSEIRKRLSTSLPAGEPALAAPLGWEPVQAAATLAGALPVGPVEFPPANFGRIRRPIREQTRRPIIGPLRMVDSRAAARPPAIDRFFGQSGRLARSVAGRRGRFAHNLLGGHRTGHGHAPWGTAVDRVLDGEVSWV